MTDTMIKNESRRDFLKVSGTVAGGLALGFYLPQGQELLKLLLVTLLMLGSKLVPIIRLPFLLQDLKWVKMYTHLCLCLLLKS